VEERAARHRLKSARVGHFASVTADNGAHVVPCCFVLDDDTLYWAVDDVKPKSTHALRRVRNIEANDRASLLVDHYDEDWSRLWWVRVDGRARTVGDVDEHRRALTLLTEKYGQYRAAPPPGPVVAIDIVSWRTWP
jgi:PPOX class probable F420-dependent enzyme